MKPLHPLILLPLGALTAAIAWAQPAEAPAQAAEPTLRRFQAEDYLLAYEVFVGNGELESALRVAQRAVRERPSDRAWRRRLAQVAEWLARTDVAAEQWRALYALGDRSDATLQALLRLAPALAEPLAALPAWQETARRRPLSEDEWLRLYWLFEDAAEPARGSRHFEAEFRRLGLPLLLELAARLAYNGGEDERALALYRERTGLEPFSAEALNLAVAIELRRDRPAAALALMRAQMHRLPPDDSALWRLLAQLAWEGGDSATAEAAYARATAGADSQPQDWVRLILLTRERQPQRAADLAWAAWQRHGQLELLLQALEIHATLGALHAQGRIYDSLSPAQRARAEQSLPFLLGRAQYHQRRAQPRAAWADLQRALQLAPREESAVLSALWFLIDAGWPQELAPLLARYDGLARQNPAYALPYAAAHQLLGQHRRAARWYQRALARNPHDPIVLAGYADALQALGHTGMADRLRRQAWQALQPLRESSGSPACLLDHPQFDTWARLASDTRWGASALGLQRLLVQQIRRSTPDAASAADALVLQAALDRQLSDSARRWMLQRYLRLGRSAPVTTQAQLALMLHDENRVLALLANERGRLSTSTRIDLALTAGLHPLAIDSAWHALNQEPSAERFHELLRQQLPLHAHYLQLGATQAAFGPLLDRLGLELQVRLVLSPSLHLLGTTTNWRQSSSDADFATLLPGHEDWQRVELRWLGRSETRLALTQQQALQRSEGLVVQQLGRWTPRLDYELALRWRQPAELTVPLRVAGREDSLRATFSYALDRHTTLLLAPQLSRYQTQYDDTLGSGSALELGLTHRLRIDYPDWYLRAYTDIRSYRRDGGLSAQTIARLPAYLQTGLGNGSIDPVGYFLPPDSSTLGLCAGLGGNLGGLSLVQDYSRAWHPYGWACATDNSVLGPGYGLSLGAAGSVLGSDQLRVEWQRSEAGSPGSTAIQVLSIRYRYYF